MQRGQAQWLALAALLAGATAIGTAPLYVRFSETGPVATAFWRVSLALPVLWLWAWQQDGARLPALIRQHRGRLFAIGFFFAGDLAVWHWSILLTTIANATLLANLAPLFVTAVAWMFWRQRPGPGFLTGLGLALAGTGLLMGLHVTVSSSARTGDLLGLLTAAFYAAYQLSVTRGRKTLSTATLMAGSSTVMAVLLLIIAWAGGDTLLPHSTGGWWTVIGLAITAQIVGQSLIAYAMAHLPAMLSSVGLLWQPVAATAFATVLVGEWLAGMQWTGALLILAGIAAARLSRKNTQ
jgi:drug/metabolite transporter (DMT)-like permease